MPNNFSEEICLCRCITSSAVCAAEFMELPLVLLPLVFTATLCVGPPQGGGNDEAVNIFTVSSGDEHPLPDLYWEADTRPGSSRLGPSLVTPLYYSAATTPPPWGDPQVMCSGRFTDQPWKPGGQCLWLGDCACSYTVPPGKLLVLGSSHSTTGSWTFIRPL